MLVVDGYGKRLSHFREIPRISIEIPRISIEILGISDRNLVFRDNNLESLWIF